MHLPEINYKKAAILIGFLLICFFLGWLIYFVFFRPLIVSRQQYNVNQQNASLAPRQHKPSGSLPSFSRQQTAASSSTRYTPYQKPALPLKLLQKVTDQLTVGPTLEKNGSFIYYNQKDGKFYILLPNGKKKLYSQKTFYDVQKITWSPDKTKAVLEFPNGSKIIYDFQQQKQINLPQPWHDFHFAPKGEKLAAKNLQYNSNYLITANIKNGSARIIEDMGDKSGEFSINWSPDQQIVGFFSKPVDFNHEEIFPLGLHGENFKSFIVDGLGFQGKWSPSGNEILYSVFNSASDYKPTLWITNRTGTLQKKLYVNTWASKCAFANDNIIYCGVPTHLKEMMTTPALAFTVDDNLYKINIKSGFVQKLPVFMVGHNVQKIMVTPDQKYLYFLDRRTGRVFRINLTKLNI